MAAQRLTNRRSNHTLDVRGYDEEVNINTPFDMTMLNDLVRFHLVMDAIGRLPQTGDKGLLAMVGGREGAERDSGSSWVAFHLNQSYSV